MLTTVRAAAVTVAALTALAMSAQVVAVPINYAGRTFDSADFADTASGTYSGIFGNAGNLTDALTGFTPTTSIINAPADTDIVLTFDDVRAINGAGADIIIYEPHSPSGYQIALRPVSGVFTPFVNFSSSALVATGVTTNVGFGTTNVLELTLDISTFGLGPGTIIDALQFRIGDGEPGDMMMAAALNTVAAAPAPEPGSLGLLAGALAWLWLWARRRAR